MVLARARSLAVWPGLATARQPCVESEARGWWWIRYERVVKVKRTGDGFYAGQEGIPVLPRLSHVSYVNKKEIVLAFGMVVVQLLWTGTDWG